MDDPKRPRLFQLRGRRQVAHEARVAAPLLADERGTAHVRRHDPAAGREPRVAGRQHSGQVREELERRDEEDRVEARRGVVEEARAVENKVGASSARP